MTKNRLHLLFAAAALVLAAAPAVAAGPYSYYSVNPCRFIDTRTGSTGVITGEGTLAKNQSRSYTVRGSCGVPVGAKAIAYNITAVAPTATGFLQAYPAGTTPTTSVVNFVASENTPNAGILVLADPGPPEFSIAAGTGQASLSVGYIVDVTGYFQ